MEIKKKRRNEMTKKEALELLKSASRDNIPSRVNPHLSQAQVVEIVEGAITESGGDLEGQIDSLMEKRVWQVTKNQKRPKY